MDLSAPGHRWAAGGTGPGACRCGGCHVLAAGTARARPAIPARSPRPLAAVSLAVTSAFTSASSLCSSETTADSSAFAAGVSPSGEAAKSCSAVSSSSFSLPSSSSSFFSAASSAGPAGVLAMMCSSSATASSSVSSSLTSFAPAGVSAKLGASAAAAWVHAMLQPYPARMSPDTSMLYPGPLM